MILPIYILYCICIGFIHVYKWLELQILKPFKPLLKRKGKQIMESIGVVLHTNDEIEWTVADNERVLSKCPKYERLVHLKIHDDSFFVRVANTGTLGFGESYMDKLWDFCESAEDITEFSRRVVENELLPMYYNRWNKFLDWLELRAFNLGSRKRAFEVGVKHYDLGNKLYEIMLDPWMQYTCGYWKNAEDLNTAQVNKMELIAKKLDLKPGMRLLDIGCGWGTLCKYLAENYQVECVGVAISQEGVTYAKELCKGLPVEIRLQDYRDINETFDRIVSVVMFEHVGSWNYREYFKVVEKCLVDDGIFLLHTIGENHYSHPRRMFPFLHKHIFPNSQLPNPKDIVNATQNLFVIEDWHNFGLDYAKTLLAWRENFLNGWSELKDMFEERFFRMWIIYLAICRGSFLCRRVQLWQLVLSKNGLQKGYRATR